MNLALLYHNVTQTDIKLIHFSVSYSTLHEIICNHFRSHHSRLRPFLIKFQAPDTKTIRIDQYASRIPKMHCMKSQQIGHGRALLGSTANSAQFWRIGQNWRCYLARPFHALFARISCNTFLESLKQTDQPLVVFVSGA